MIDPQQTRSQLDAFAAAYDYDVGYLHAILAASPAAFEAFAAARGLSHFRQALPLDAHFVARVTTVRADDCGPCTRLNLKMSVEAGVDRALLQTLIERPQALPGPLADVWAHAVATVHNEPRDAEREDRLRAAYGAAGFVELALAIAGSRLYPTLKRALGHADACEPVSLETLAPR